VPEGPEIRKAADKIEQAIARRPLTRVFFAFEHLKPYEALFTGGVVERVRTVGKAMLTDVLAADGAAYTIYSHNQLYGRWNVRKSGPYPDSRRSLRLALGTETKMALLYSATDIAVMPRGAEAEHPFIRRAGPDALDVAVTPALVAERLADKRFARRRLGGLLLDQAFLTGIGNYLRSEALFLARVDPEARPADLSDAQRLALAEALLWATRQSYAHGGLTVPVELAAELKARGVPRRGYRHHVFGRDGRPCHHCGAPVERQESAGRRVYVCPACQPRAAGWPRRPVEDG
jgi:endonuclease-8